MDAAVDISKTTLETERLILRPWREEDVEDFYEYASVDGVGQMAGWKPHESIEESEKILRGFIDQKKTFALVLKENGKAIGSLGLESQREELDESFSQLQGREIGYVLSKAYWGRGLMPEAVSRVIRHCFGDLGWDYVLCGHFEDNRQSRRVIEKCGFRFYRNILFETRMGEVKRTKLYVLRRSEYEKRRL